ncbi:MAG: YtxH domain-containing protein [Micrococcales bacterium]|nr:YtxH domain-containing protein [Micrococcales bacterium]
MRGKFLFVVGAAVGYVVGTRQGRQAYVKLKGRAEDLWKAPAVQNSVESAREFVKDKVPIVGEKVAQVGKKAATAAADKLPGSDPSDASESSGGADAAESSDVATSEAPGESPRRDA